MSRRTLLRTAFGATAASAALPACGSDNGRIKLRFHQSKTEVLEYFGELVQHFNQAQQDIAVIHDMTENLVAPLVREDPHDLACWNYNYLAGTLVVRDVLTDLRELPEMRWIEPSVQELVGQYATPDRSTHVLPYSIAASGVVYNKELFEKHRVDVPTTWSEFIDACERFAAADVTPIYMTFREPWTIQQGLFDYLIGGLLDVAGFYADLKAAGARGGTPAGVSFRESFTPAVEKMVHLLRYTNPDAHSRTYPDGNAAVAQGTAAMYLQGPWGIGEVTKANPKIQLGSFPLPATDDPADLKVAVNLDLALWIPKQAAEPEAARRFLSHLMQPEVMHKYNADNLGMSPTRDAPQVTDERISGLEPYVRRNAFYQPAGSYIPPAIPLGNYLQEFVLNRDVNGFLDKLDADWHRFAERSA